MHWRVLQKVQALCLCKQLHKQNYWHLGLDVWNVPCSWDQKVKWSEGQREKLTEKWKLNTEAVCALGRVVILAFTSRAKFSWIQVLFTFLLPHKNYFKLLTDVLGGRRGLHSTWFSVLISSLLQALYGMILLPYKLAVNLNIKWGRQNATYSPPWLLTAENFPLCSEI